MKTYSPTITYFLTVLNISIASSIHAQQLAQQQIFGENVLVRQNFNSNQIPRQNNPLNIDFSKCSKTVQVKSNQNSCNFVGGGKEELG